MVVGLECLMLSSRKDLTNFYLVMHSREQNCTARFSLPSRFLYVMESCMVGGPGNVATYIPICKHILETEKLCSAESRGVLCGVVMLLL